MRNSLWSLLALLCALLAACSSSQSTRSLVSDLPSNQEATVLVVGDSGNLKYEAEALNLEVSGDAVLQIHGNTDKISQLRVAKSNEVFAMLDESVGVEKFENTNPPDETIYYLAKKDFGLPDYWKTHPTHDGRGVVVGVLDDGVVTRASGFQTTSDGKRKLLAKASDNTILSFTLSPVTDRETLSSFAKSAKQEFANAWQGQLDETTLRPVISEPQQPTGDLDINQDGKKTKIDLAVFAQDGKTTVCVDSTVNGSVDENECFGTFEATGQAGYWDAGHLLSIDAEFDSVKGTLTLGSGERNYSHGSGVASVVAGHLIGGKFDGVAPGAQLLDYNLSAPTADNVSAYYTIGKFVRGLEWLGQKKADIVNISYSFFFHSAKSQEFIKKAFQAVTTKYGYVIAFSAGNNGPGLGSMNRRPVYPQEALVNGAFVSRELDEYVHGVTGLPPEGRVVFYSSRGPSSDRGAGPMVISPLASLAHANPELGYWAFSGTSSASPAAAGLAAVLLSAVKEMGWKKDALALVHAIRMSGQPLPNVPFVDQGYGLPKIEKALEAYKKIIDAENFATVTATVGPTTSPDGVASSGVFLRSSQMTSDSVEFRANLKGIAGSTVTKDKASALLVPVKIYYSADWLRGANRLWVSVGASGFNFEVLRPANFENEMTGEIRVVRSDNEELLLVIPVTLVNDQALNRTLETQVTLGAEEGKRFHFSVPTGVKAALFDFGLSSGINPASISARFYNAASVYTQTAITTQFLVPIYSGGWNQIAVSRNKGSETPAVVGVTVRPVNVQLAQGYLQNQAKTLEMDVADTDGRTALEFEVSEPRKVLASAVFETAKTKGLATVQFPLVGKGFYRTTLSPVVKTEMIYPSFSCLLSVMTEEKMQYLWGVSSDSDQAITEDLKGIATSSCYSFEHVDDNNTYGTTVLLEVSYTPDSTPAVLASGRTTLKNGRTSVPLTWTKQATAGSVLKVNVKTVSGTGSAGLGDVKVY